MPAVKRPRPVVLCILDGWGHRDDGPANAIAGADNPVWKRLVKTGPTALLDTAGAAVGLPAGQMGNSEVGHMNLGAGRIAQQDLPRIDAAVADGALADRPRLTAFLAMLKASGGTAHLMGLISPGGVHSHQDHIVALARAMADAGVPVAVHAILDGRDTPPRAGRDYVAKFLDALAGLPTVRIGLVSGRYYAMDRDKRWDRVTLAYDAMTLAEGERADDALAAIGASYAADTGDEFVRPTVIGDYAGMRDGDGVVMANFRADRVREILAALLDPAFDGFARRRTVAFAAAVGMTEYSSALTALIAPLFEPLELRHTLGGLVADAGMRQLRIAETEKYAHVTFFFNGGEERQLTGEERILIPSPKVATYDLQPEMSAPEVTDRLVAAIAEGAFDLIVLNYANGDMVGHTGDYAAAVKAVEAVDACLGRLERAVAEAGGTLIITADHGNCERMADDDGAPHTAHTVGPVPIVMVGAPEGITGLKNGRLADVAPTVLDLLGLAKPVEMTGDTLLVRAGSTARAAAE